MSEARDRGEAVRACTQCGLSIGEAATFCQVCGTPVEPATTAAAAAPVAAPDPVLAGPVSGAEGTDDQATVADAGSDDGPADLRSRTAPEVSGLLQDASACEATDAARAADLYREAIVGCLDATEDPLGREEVRRDLLCGFDSLSRLLEREGLPAEALDVVDGAVSLGLLDDPDGAAPEHYGALRDRREDLRHILHGDSAQL